MYYFASDVHLGAGGEQWTRHTEQRFVRWLDMAASDADGIFLLGDIFDFWWEYRKVVPKGFVRTFGKLAELTDRGVKIYLITGNHDMWAKDYLKQECGVEVFFTPQQIKLSGKNLFLAHGDNMNVGNKPMLKLMNTGFRSPMLRTLFSWLIHPDIAMSFGQWWSGKSRKSHSGGYLCVESLGFLVEYAKGYQKRNPQTDYIIFGHMHFAHDYEKDGLRVCFLSNWDDKVEYAVLDNEGKLSLKTFE